MTNVTFYDGLGMLLRQLGAGFLNSGKVLFHVLEMKIEMAS